MRRRLHSQVDTSTNTWMERQIRQPINIDTSENSRLNTGKNELSMISYLKIFFGCRGTWFWACRQMKEGKTVRRFRDSGVVKFTYDEGRRKIMAMIEWETSVAPKEWGISIEDVFATDFQVQDTKVIKRTIGCFATIIGKTTPHRFEIGAHVVVMSADDKRAYVKDTSVSQGEYVLLKDLKDETI